MNHSHTVPRASPILPVFSFESVLDAAFGDVSFFPFRPLDAEDRAILGCTFRPFGLSPLVLGNYSPRRGPWALMESGPGPQILWPHKVGLDSNFRCKSNERKY